MAHDFIKQMLNGDDKSFRLKAGCCLLGTFLCLNSFLAQWLDFSEAIVSTLSLLGALLLGLPLIAQALGDLFRGKSDMNELAALSFLAAFSMGSYRTAAAVAFFMLLSILIEYRSEVGARKNLTALLKLSPQKASRLDGDQETEILAQELNPGDRVRVRPGDRIPADAVVCDGSSLVNEASITGEAMPAQKQSGSTVYAGTINLTGLLELTVLKSSDNSTLAKIKQLIQEAEKSQNRTMRLMDRYASYYTPMILMMAALVLFFTRDLNRAISLLIIACPCTVLLSIPSAKIAALSAAASLGVIIKNVASIELAAKLSAFVFDKTGTLTTGLFSVTALMPEPNVTEEELLQAAASLEFNSKHPLATAVVKLAKERGIQLSPCNDFEELAGYGVKSEHLLCGNRAFLKKHGCEAPELHDIKGFTILMVVRDGQYLGYLKLADTIRPDAADALQELRNAGVTNLVMITGDRQDAAEITAKALNCKLMAETLPADKLKKVKALREEGNVVAVVGDGVNDAPALAAGDVSIAMGAAGSDVAISSSSVVLLNEHMNRIPFFLNLSQATCAIMVQNLAFSLSCLLLFVILSILGLLPPFWAAVLHASCATAVVMNSSRLFHQGDSWA